MKIFDVSKGIKRRYSQLNVFTNLFVDESYQRVEHRSVKKIAENWDERLVGTIKVAYRGNDGKDAKFAIIDGAHRVAAFKLMLQKKYGGNIPDDEPFLWCEVLSGLSVEDEAYIFSMQDNLKVNVTPSEKLKAARVTNDKNNLYVIIDHIVKQNGLKFVKSGYYTPGVRCIEALRRATETSGRDFAVFYCQLLAKSKWSFHYDSYSLFWLRAFHMLFKAGMKFDDVFPIVSAMNPDGLRYAACTWLKKAKVTCSDMARYISERVSNSTVGE